MKKQETSIKNKIYKFLKEDMGGWCIKTSGSQYQQNGIPDIIACIRGLFISIECKVGDGKVKRIQQTAIDEIQKKGNGIAIIMKSFDKQDRAWLINYIETAIDSHLSTKSMQGPYTALSGVPEVSTLDAYRLSLGDYECQGNPCKNEFAEYFIPKFKIKFLCSDCIKMYGITINIKDNG